MHTVLEGIREELRSKSDEGVRKSGQRFFKEEVRLHGVKAPEVEKIARAFFKTVQNEGKKAIFTYCEKLFRSGYLEESFIACHWAYALRREYEPEDFPVFETWIGSYISNWASCDTFCNHTVGAFVEMYPAHIENLKSWTQSENRWVRRGAVVSLIVPARRGKFLAEVFAIADLLLCDSDDMVQKGYGWMLKAASQAHQKEVFDFVMARKSRMPRVALRYAIEKMPEDLRKQAMEKRSPGFLLQ